MVGREIRRWVASVLTNWLVAVTPKSDVAVLKAIGALLQEQHKAGG